MARSPEQATPSVSFGILCEMMLGCVFRACCPCGLLTPSVCRKAGLVPTEDNVDLRSAVVESIHSICEALCAVNAPSISPAPSKWCSIAPFGSYGLGAHSSSSDLDLVAVLPRHVTRAGFFAAMPSLLAHVHQLEELIVLADAYVPVIKFKLRGVSVDLLCCCMDVSSVPPSLNLTADAALLLAKADPKGLLALNGVRICDFLLQHTPHTARFRRLLRLVKLWAGHRGLYGSTQQYLAGISWAILVAHYLRSSGPCSLLDQLKGFFEKYAHWDWPKPVQLTEEPQASASLPTLPSWSQATSSSDAMPIITPCWPSMNSAHYVSDTTCRVLTHEMACAAEVLRQFQSGQLPGGAAAVPRALMRSPPVLDDAHVLLLVRVSAGSQSGFLSWRAFLSTRLRLLCLLVETASTPTCQLSARLWPYPLHEEDTEEDTQPAAVADALASHHSSAATSSEATEVAAAQGHSAAGAALEEEAGSGGPVWLPSTDLARLTLAEESTLNLQPAAFFDTWAVAVTVHSAVEGPQKVDLTKAIRVFSEKLETWKAAHLAEHAQCGMVCVKAADAKMQLL